MTPEDESRYNRQIKLPQIGEEGQQKIIDASALIIGMGGLGSPAALYLAAAGIGRLIISDYDVVEESNLQRQIIHQTDNIGDLKAHSAKQSIHRINPECKVETIADSQFGLWYTYGLLLNGKRFTGQGRFICLHLCYFQ